MKIRFHYRGYFSSDPVVAYKNGEIHEFRGEWDIDEINLIDLDNLIRDIGVRITIEEEWRYWIILKRTG